MLRGYLALVLHGHLPFVRHPEYEDCLEEQWLHEAVLDAYLPLIRVMEGWIRDGIRFRLTLSLSPTLLAMFLDPLLQSRILHHINRLIELSEREARRTRGQPEFSGLAEMYRARFSEARDLYLRYDQNLIRAFREFQEVGALE